VLTVRYSQKEQHVGQRPQDLHVKRQKFGWVGHTTGGFTHMAVARGIDVDGFNFCKIATS